MTEMKIKNSTFEVLLNGIVYKILKLDSKYTRFKHRNVKCEQCGVNPIDHIAYMLPKYGQIYAAFSGEPATISYESHYFCSDECSEKWFENHRGVPYKPVTEDKMDLIEWLLWGTYKGVTRLMKYTIVRS